MTEPVSMSKEEWNAAYDAFGELELILASLKEEKRLVSQRISSLERSRRVLDEALDTYFYDRSDKAVPSKG